MGGIIHGVEEDLLAFRLEGGDVGVFAGSLARAIKGLSSNPARLLRGIARLLQFQGMGIAHGFDS